MRADCFSCIQVVQNRAATCMYFLNVGKYMHTPVVAVKRESAWHSIKCRVPRFVP